MTVTPSSGHIPLVKPPGFFIQIRTNLKLSMLVCPAGCNFCFKAIGSSSDFQDNSHCVPTQGESPFLFRKNHFTLIQREMDVRRGIELLSFRKD